MDTEIIFIISSVVADRVESSVKKFGVDTLFLAHGLPCVEA